MGAVPSDEMLDDPENAAVAEVALPRSISTDAFSVV